ncbi:MAG: hypothetical protein IPH20_22890 [Bacteroidales bacterium]|nr:hypothetical protein [Bacteroidales bacterium]
MKNKLITGLLIIAVFSVVKGFSQNSCEVMKQALTGTYTGGCKKGLAHGKGIAQGADRYEGQFKNGLPDGEGTYYWSGGEIYRGDWKEGKRHGIGIYTFHGTGSDTIRDGHWVNDHYAGPVVPKPQVISKEGVDRFTFKKGGDATHRVMINMYQNGARNMGISNLMLSSSSGYESTLGPATGFEEVTFPVIIKVMYSTPNKTNTTEVYVKFEFKISEPGDWTVDLHN